MWAGKSKPVAALDNGVTHIDQIDMALLGPRVHGLVAGYPGRLGRVGHGAQLRYFSTIASRTGYAWRPKRLRQW